MPVTAGCCLNLSRIAEKQKTRWRRREGAARLREVAVRNWQPWVRQGVHEITNPMGFFSRVKLDYPVSLGDYRFPSHPDEPMVLHLVHVPNVPPGSGSTSAARGVPAAPSSTRGRSPSSSARSRRAHPHARARAASTGDSDVAADHGRPLGPRVFVLGLEALFENKEGDDEAIPACGEQARRPRRGSPTATPAGIPYAHAAIDQADRAVNELLGAPAKRP